MPYERLSRVAETFSIPPILAVWDEKWVFQQPRLFETTTVFTVHRFHKMEGGQLGVTFNKPKAGRGFAVAKSDTKSE